MTYVADVLLVTPAAYRATAAQLVAQVTGNIHDAAPESFALALTAPSSVVVTHYAARVRVRIATLAALPQLAASIPGGLWHVTAHDDDTPEERDARLSVEDFLATHNLALYTPEDEI